MPVLSYYFSCRVTLNVAEKKLLKYETRNRNHSAEIILLSVWKQLNHAGYLLISVMFSENAAVSHFSIMINVLKVAVLRFRVFVRLTVAYLEWWSSKIQTYVKFPAHTTANTTWSLFFSQPCSIPEPMRHELHRVTSSKRKCLHCRIFKLPLVTSFCVAHVPCAMHPFLVAQLLFGLFNFFCVFLPIT